MGKAEPVATPSFPVRCSPLSTAKGRANGPEAVVANHLRHGLLHRIGNELDIANAAVFLASDESSYITGHELVVDGGLTVHMPHMADEIDIVEELMTLYRTDANH